MPNNKIERIVRDIEYRKPAGALEEYKYGVRVRRQVAPSQGDGTSNIIEPSLEALRKEISRAPKPVKMPTADLVGEDG